MCMRRAESFVMGAHRQLPSDARGHGPVMLEVSRTAIQVLPLRRLWRAPLSAWGKQTTSAESRGGGRGRSAGRGALRMCMGPGAMGGEGWRP